MKDGKNSTMRQLWELQEARRKDRDQYNNRRKRQVFKSPLSLQQMMTAFFAKDPESRKKIREGQAIAAWEKIVGETAARYSTALRVRSQTLYVQVNDPLWMQQLSFLKQDILEKYKELFPETKLRDLYFIRSRT